MVIRCSTADCKWAASDSCSNKRLVNQVRTGAVSASSCSGTQCKGYEKKV